MKRLATMVLAAMAFSAAVSAAAAGELGFLEDFALAPDRAVPLKQLIPGTEDYYYYNCLHLQNAGLLDQVDPMLKLWIQRTGRTERVIEIENRQALLRYPADPKASLAFIQQRLNLQFNHQREVLNQEPNLPSVLDPALISREAFAKVALANNAGTVDGFEDSALDWLAGQDLSADRRRNLLGRLKRPDVPNLVKLVLDDLKAPNSGGFGSIPIHKQMLLAQMQELLKQEPDLINHAEFVDAWLTKLQPSADVDWRHDPQARQDYLDHLWAFAAPLPPAFNSLKANILYQRLAHDRALGVYDKDRFMAYIQLPRNMPYVNPKWLDEGDHRHWQADLSRDFQAVTLLEAVHSDEPLVRDYFQHFFVEEDTYQPYAAFIRDTWLKAVFAETKIVNGIGDQEKWYSLLDARAYQALKDRVDLEFAFTNKTLFGADEPVSLDLFVKNAPTLIVKVYQINALNFYRQNLTEIDTDVNLDGLVANEEKTYDYSQTVALRREKRHYDFPTLAGPGTYVVEFIGGGTSSRALIHKGRLHYLLRTGSAGQVFTVLDDAGKKAPQAKVWLAGHEYSADADGEIAVPFSTAPGRTPVILINGDQASLDFFEHQGETYALAAGIHVERESLLKNRKATVIIRPSLTVNGTPVALSLLQNISLSIVSTDLDGIATTKNVPDFKLFEDRDTTYEFQVPDRLMNIAFTLKAQVQSLSENKKIDLAVSKDFGLNYIDIDKTECVEDAHLSKVAGQYVLDLLGKTGEAKPCRPIHLEIKHRDFGGMHILHLTLETDKDGRIFLGTLDGIEWFLDQLENKYGNSWIMPSDKHSHVDHVHALAGQVICIAYMGQADKVTPAEFSLLERRGQTYVADWLSTVKLKNGFLEIQGLPAGDYELLTKSSSNRALTQIHVSAGPVADGYVLGPNRYLQLKNASPLQITTLAADADKITLQLANATKATRVHLAATKFMPHYPMPEDLVLPTEEPAEMVAPKSESLYLAGRNIGDEYRYILDRKYAHHFPGTMLIRPSLLLNPWDISKTETGSQAAKAGEEWMKQVQLPGLSDKLQCLAKTYPGLFAVDSEALSSFSPNLDFLSQPAVVLANLKPDANGMIVVNRKDLGAHQYIQVIAEDSQNTVYRQISLPEIKMDFRDLRLAKSLDAAKHYVEQKQVTLLAKDQKLVLSGLAGGGFEVYDSLPAVFRLYRTLDANGTLEEFSFIIDWPHLTPAQKQEKYSKYACHELNFFLFKKDPEFFTAVVLPYLKNKKDKTFLDHYLIGDDLAAFAQPWTFGQLNVVEQALLGQRLADQQAAMARHVQDRYDLMAPDAERFNFLFRTALGGSSLETAGSGGVALVKSGSGTLLLTNTNGYAGGTVVNQGGLVAREAAAENPETPNAPTELAAPAPAAKPAGAVANEPVDKLTTVGGDEDAKRLDVAKQELGRKTGNMAKDAAARDAMKQLYRKLDKTEEWVENNYYHLPIAQQDANLVTVNGFWRDYAASGGKGPFLSAGLAEASHSFTEAMFALAVTDLPFEAPKQNIEYQDNQATLTAAGPMIVYHKEIKEAADSKDPSPGAAGHPLPQGERGRNAAATQEKTPILVSQNYFRLNDRYRYDGNEQIDKYVTDEFLTSVVYGCQIVITNPTSSRQRLDLLVQVPAGAMPVMGGQYTKGVYLDLAGYSTTTFEYHFYFPAAGEFEHYGVTVAKAKNLLASLPAAKLKVVATASVIDRMSWDYISQNGSGEEVLKYLQDNNLSRIDLDRIAFRMRDRDFYQKTLALLSARFVYNHTLWSYGILHDDAAAIGQYLQHRDDFIANCGSYIDSKLLTIDPVARKAYQHMEYAALVNARAHRLGKARTILNGRLFEQYHRLLKILSCRAALDDDDRLAVTYYLLLQDRLAEAVALFGQINADKLPSRLQYDYVAAYLDFLTDDHKLAAAIAFKYKDYPVDRWRNLFGEVAGELAEAAGKSAAVTDKTDRTQEQTHLAAGEASFDMSVEARKVTLKYQNMARCQVNYYLMDIELLFSRDPFVQQYSNQFSVIRPNETQKIDLPADKQTFTFDLPEKFASSNVMVEVVAGGAAKSQAYFANSLAVQVIENYGQIKVSHDKTGAPLAKVYVKVYARMRNGEVQFYKDGYTDLRGRFEYASLSTDELDHVDAFRILVLSDTDGTVVKEAKPPKR